VNGPRLITGAGGFIGSRVCRLLAWRGEPFVGLLRPGEAPPPAPGKPWPAGSFRIVDIRDAAATADCVAEVEPRAILNLAAVGVAPHGGEALAEFVVVNVLAPGVLYQAMADECVLVQAGSMAQYAGAKGALGEETAKRVDATPYAWSKNAAEGLLGTLAAQRSKPVVRLRLFGVTGPGEASHRLLPSIVAGWRERKPIDLSDGLQIRDLLHVDDVAAAIVHAAGAEALFGKAVNVGQGQGGSVRWMAERAARRLGCPALLRFGVLARRPGEPAELIADATRLRGTGWAPERTLERAVDDVVDELAGRAPAR
jgi:nucleoside-diphosphate-sugar epimerase